MTFTFTMDAMPGYTYFNNAKQVLCTFQIFEDAGSEETRQPVMREISHHASRGNNDDDIGNSANPGS